MKLLTNIIKYVISAILAISIMLFLIIHLASSTILDKNYVLSKLEEIDYYDKIHEEVKSNFENYIYQSGLEENMLDDIVSKEKIQKDTQLILNNLYEGTEQQINTQEIKDNFYKKIETTMGMSKLNTTQKTAIDVLVDKICNVYTTAISHNSYEKQIYTMYQKVQKYLDIAKKATLIIMFVSIVFLLLLNIKTFYTAFTFLGVSIMTSGILFIIINTFVQMKVKIQMILIVNKAISEVLRNILAQLLNRINQYGYIMLIAGLLLIVIFNAIQYGLKNKTDEE